MRRRTWVFIILALLIFLGSVPYYALKIFHANEEAKRIILERLQPMIGSAIQVNKVEIGIGSIFLKEVQIRSKSFQINVPQIRVGYSFLNLIQNDFKPLGVFEEFYFRNPRIVLFNQKKLKSDTTRAHVIFPDLWKEMASLGIVARISITDGSLASGDTLTQDVIVQNIDGWVDLRNPSRIQFRVEFGSSVGKEKGSWNGLADLKNKRLESKLSLSEYQVKYERKIDRADISLLTRITGELSFNKKDSVSGPQLTGKLTFRDIQIRSEAIELYRLSGTMEAGNDSVRYHFVSSKINERRGEINGSIGYNFNGPVVIKFINFNSEFEHIPVHLITSFFQPDSANRWDGTADCKTRIIGSGRSPRIELILRSSQFKYSKLKIGNFYLKARIENDLVTLDSSSFQVQNIHFQHRKGIFALNPLQVNVPFSYFGYQYEKSDSSLFIVDGKGILEGKDRFSEIRISTRPEFRNEKRNIHWFGEGVFTNDQLGFHFSERDSSQFEFQFENSIDPKVTFKLFLSDVAKYSDTFSFLSSNNINQLSIAGNGTIKTSILGDFRLSGQRTDNKIYGNFSFFRLLEDSRSGGVNWSADFGGSIPLKGQARFAQNNEIIYGRLSVENFLNCQLDWDTNTEQMNGDASLQIKSTTDLKPYFKYGFDNFSDGNAEGQIKISGLRGDPKISGDLAISKLTLFNQKDFSLDFSFFYEKKNWKIKSLEVDQQGNKIIWGTGGSSKGNLKVDINGANVPMNLPLSIFLKSKITGEGLAAFYIQFRGTESKPKFSAEFRSTRGSLSKIIFDDFHIVIKDSVYRSEVVPYLSQLTLVRNNQYGIKIDGFLPGKSSLLDLHSEIWGDWFSLIPEVEPFFKEAHASTVGKVQIRGDLANPQISDLDIEIRNGYLRLSDVTDEIQNINGRIKKNDPSSIIRFEELTGITRGRSFRFYTRPGTEIQSSRTLKHWSFANGLLDFGVIVLETDPAGIPLHIPSVMEKNDIGNLQLSGKNSNEQFYFAGPPDHPSAYGKVNLTSCRIWYPFLGADEPTKKKSRTVRFLESIDWDVSLNSLNNNHYLNVVPAYIDNVYIDLLIDDQIGGLHFKGVIKDKSFRVAGKLLSNRGSVEYLDLHFKPEEFGVEFDESSELPIVYGRATATVVPQVQNSTNPENKTVNLSNNARNIFLTLYTIDFKTKTENPQGRWGDLKFRLTSDDPQLQSQEQILNFLGYSVENIKSKATELSGKVIENAIVRPLVIRPLEKRLQRSLGLDIVKFNSNVARNLIFQQFGYEQNTDPTNVSAPAEGEKIRNRYYSDYRSLFESSQIIIGKYLASGFFLTYTGELVSNYSDPLVKVNDKTFGLKHTVGLEYRLSPEFYLNLDYDYNKLQIEKYLTDPNRHYYDLKMQVRYSFPF